MDEIAAPLKETLENSRTMLNRCTELCERTNPQCTCKSDLESAQKEIKGLRSTCEMLENKTKEQKDAMKEVTQTINELKAKIETLLKQTVLDDDKGRVEHTDTIKKTTTVISSDYDAELRQNPKLGLKPTSIEEAKPGQSILESQREHSVHYASTSAGEIRNTARSDESKRQTKDLTETRIDKVEVVKQESKHVPFGEAHWRSESQDELNESRKLFSELKGVHTILCVDISESMVRNNGWQEASTFVKDYLQGLQEVSRTSGITNEFVAMVTFGHETIVKQRYTNKYDEMLEVFDNLKLGGPSPLFGGMLMSLAAAWCSRQKMMLVGLGTHVGTRIIIISDGRPTDTNLVAGPDNDSPLDTDGTTSLILQEMEHYRSQRFDVFFVPVGNSDNHFFDTMLGISEGIMLDHNSGRRLARRHYLSTKLTDTLGLLPIPMQLMSSMSSDEMTEEDMEDIKSIQERTKSRVMSDIDLGGIRQDHYNERQRTTLPTIGSRVRRGPDWMWNQQDSSGPGTVIGHHPNDEQVWVEWDADKHQNVYRYGVVGYDVIIVDEPRKVPEKRLLAVGCTVKPGVKWKFSEPRQKSGAVIKLDTKQKNATVRWDNGRRGEYSYDTTNEEIVYSPPFEPFYSRGHTLGYTADDSTAETNTDTHSTKNKNVFPN